MKTNILILTLISLFALNLNMKAQSYVAIGTQITMGDDVRQGVEKLAVGDVVLSYDHTKDVYEKKKVASVDKIMFNRTARIVLENGMQILLTSDYPFWSERGWISIDPETTVQNPKYKSVKSCKIGDYLYFYDILSTSSERISVIEGILEPIMVYNIKLEGGGSIVANGFIIGVD
ncbi:hypothetical protein D0T84_17285 [Dysgonomonas sp. 521]|uniref:Hint domain-containing protein n=1 Tax=Dysgonomonas sp. 521 TaxID=2302932 RepID=UPI0013D40AAE|nr:Hint domain-containing protein [Dysgonomonas sp. 521]NDV96652.1 hypothetical protein [Dysgonomonas sp. 521]